MRLMSRKRGRTETKRRLTHCNNHCTVRLMKAFISTHSAIAALALGFVVATLPTAHAVETAPNGVPIVGEIFILEKYVPEPGIFDIGYVRLLVSEEGTRKLFEFHSEDSTCAAFSGRFNAHVCAHEAEMPQMASLRLGERIRVTQSTSFLGGGRRTFEVEALN
jgi:hypothetical protein